MTDKTCSFLSFSWGDGDQQKKKLGTEKVNGLVHNIFGSFIIQYNMHLADFFLFAETL